jgi:dihydrofolate reductase
MRKLIFQNMISLDGYFEGPNHEIDWHVVDQEFNDFAKSQLDTVDTLIFGRITYELMASYWPTPAALQDDPIIARYMNETRKLVFSMTMDHLDWQNSQLIKENPVEAIARLKQQPGKNMIIFGSADLSSPLINHGLIDEFSILIGPVILGRGTPLFQGIQQRIKLKLVESKALKTGVISLVYRPEP